MSARQASSDAVAAWHSISCDDALGVLQTKGEGLSSDEADRRLALHGPNRLPTVKARGPLGRLLAQFHNVLIYVLLGSAVITLLLGHPVDAAVIAAVVILNALIGFVQEGRAERSLDAIRAMLTPRASVIRDGRRLAVNSDQLVPGDLVLLEAGDRVAADLRLVRARNLHLQEAVLTGESVPVEKSPAPVAKEASLGDRASMAFSGTLVSSGSGLGVVVATGAATELGRISALVGKVETLTTPLLRQMNGFARRLTAIILGVAAIAFAFAVLARGYPVEDAFMAMVGMAVAAIPEGLPAVLTITLAIGVQRMARRNAIIRRLPAVETLGSVSIICSDKTGTLTRNEMTVRAAVTPDASFEVTGAGYNPRGGFSLDGREIEPASHADLIELARAALLCNDASLRETISGWVVDGDPMEGALKSFAIKAGLDSGRLPKRLPRDDEIPFDAQYRFMATLHHGHENGSVIFVKGAPERVLELCDRQRAGGRDEEGDIAFWLRRIDDLAAEGHRVLAVAAKRASERQQTLTFADVEAGLTMLGVVGLIDAPRDEAIAAVHDCRAAGIRVKMITGDHAATAAAIAAQLGLDNAAEPATGQMLDRLDADALRQLARDTDVFARTSPEHKLRLVEALQADGAVVAMTGDGVNDAPALKRADVGVAMGQKGTEAAKEAAEMVLADDNFASIVAAVREGRTVYDNLKKVIAWTLPTNGGEAMSIVAAILFGLTLPITPVQILWINMVTAVALGLTLAFEPTEPDAMRRPPRAPSEPLLSGFLAWRVIFVSVLFVIGAFGMFFWAERQGLSLEEARTLVVNTIVVMEVFYLFSVRYLRVGSLTWRGFLWTPAVLAGVAAIIVLQLAFTYAPAFQDLFATRPVSFRNGLLVVAVGATLFAVLELEKRTLRRLTSAHAARSTADDGYRGRPSGGRANTGKP